MNGIHDGLYLLQRIVELEQEQQNVDQEIHEEQRRMEDIDAQIKKLTDETNALKNKWAPPHTGGLVHSIFQCPESFNLCYACQAVTEQTCVLQCGHSIMTLMSGTSISLNLED